MSAVQFIKCDIRKESDGDKRREIEAKYKDLIERAMFARKAYYTTQKMILILNTMEMFWCLWMQLVVEEQYSYRAIEKNEPARHEMCKIESTIIKVHGVNQSSYHNTGVRDAKCQFDFWMYFTRFLLCMWMNQELKSWEIYTCS